MVARRWLSSRLYMVGAVLLSLVAQSAAAQTIHGVVRDAGSGVPVPGVVVLALDTSSATRARVVADVRGVYTVIADPTVRTLRFVRIGFVPEERRVAPSDSGAVTLDVAMHAVSHML